jgi:AmiR/NasT family two-component response regulator
MARQPRNRGRGTRMFHTDEELIEALGPHETIGQAVALLCAEHGVDEVDAFEMLVKVSGESSRRVRKVAATIVRQSTRAHDNT